MIHREREHLPRPLRELSARLLEDQLVRLSRANAVIERLLGPGLRRMSGERLYRRLGFVRLGDYLTERLGMSLRRCQSIVRCERALTRLPAVAAAFDAGDLRPSKMRAILDVATEETQELWLARARRFPVRELEKAARAARRENATASDDLTLDDVAPAPQDPATSPTRGEDPGVNVAFRAPGRAVALWHWALDLVRRAAGHQEPAWRCVEYLAAEFLSGATLAPSPIDAGDTASSHDRGVSAVDEQNGDSTSIDASISKTASTAGAVPDALIWNEATAAARDALRPLGRAADPDVILTGQPSPGAASPSSIDPWDLDVRLRGLIRLRQSLAWRQGRLLAVIAARNLYEELGSLPFGDWCRATLGISPRRARYLVSLDRRIRRLPRTADAYRRGLLSWSQTRHLVRIATPKTESRWIRFARRVTVRRLEEAIAQSEVESAETIGALLPGTGGNALPPETIHADPTQENDAAQADDRAQADDAARANDAARENDPAQEYAPAQANAPARESDSANSSSRHMCAPSLSFDDRHGRIAGGQADRRIGFWLPTDVAPLWRDALAACRRGAQRDLAEWQCLVVMIDALKRTWDAPEDRGWKRRYRIFERDGWRCRVPGCTSRANLNMHHIVFRSRGGSGDDPNLVTLCVGHHQRGIHEGTICCSGTAPDDLWWELGSRSSGPPLLRCLGDRILRGGSPMRPR